MIPLRPLAKQSWPPIPPQQHGLFLIHQFVQRRLLASAAPTQTPQPTIANTGPASTPPTQPPKYKPEKESDLKHLDRPLGLPSPPQPGQNSGIDPRNWQERRDDLFNWDKHLARRRELIQKASKPYFRDWSNLRYHKGKLYIAPSRLLRADRAFYFPNLRGVTLAEPKDEQDTTNVLKGAISILRVYTGRWAERQADTFIEGEKKLGNFLTAGEGIVQMVNINIEENAMKSRLVKLFMGWQRRAVPTTMHTRSFLVTRGITDEIRYALGMFNSQIAYTFLVDGNCKVRWAGCAEANTEERASMMRGLNKLVSEMKTLQDVGESSKDPAARKRLNSFVTRMPSLIA